MKCVVLAFLFLLLSAVPSFAEDDCADSCGSVAFLTKPPVTVSLGSADSCKVKITYKTRKCGYIYDVRILQIEPITDCSSLSGEELIDLATTMFMFKNQMGFPTYADTAKTWRIYRAACWYSDTTISSSGIYVPCDHGGCCVTTVGAVLNSCDGLYFIPMTQKEEVACSGSCPGSINVCGRNPANRFTKPTDKW